ncbi:hypothetical protein DENSPDRAFT_853859 [Dentipellis sp. KUC8613]|nr:hypothetical protein DENSPDRAFT_853859 [Dentipellis sp. KUC8613]
MLTGEHSQYRLHSSTKKYKPMSEEIFYVRNGKQWGGNDWRDKLWDLGADWEKQAKEQAAKVTADVDPVYVLWLVPTNAAYEHSLNTEPYLNTPLAVVDMVNSIKPITAEFLKWLNDPARPPVNVDRGAIRKALEKTTNALEELAHTDFTKIPVDNTARFARKAFSSAYEFMDELSPTSNLLNAGKIGKQAAGNAEDPQGGGHSRARWNLLEPDGPRRAPGGPHRGDERDRNASLRLDRDLQSYAGLDVTDPREPEGCRVLQEFGCGIYWGYW